MLDIGIQELLIVMVLALLIFGPEKLPELGKRLGRAMREFRRASDEFRSTVEQNLQLHADQDILPPSAPAPSVATAVADPVVGATAGTTDGTGGASTPEGNGAVPHADEGPTEPYWASRGGRLVHRSTCTWRARVPAAERLHQDRGRGHRAGAPAVPGLRASRGGSDRQLTPSFFR